MLRTAGPAILFLRLFGFLFCALNVFLVATSMSFLRTVRCVDLPLPIACGPVRVRNFCVPGVAVVYVGPLHARTL